MKTQIEATDGLYKFVKLFTSCKDGWQTCEERADLYRKMVVAMEEYERSHCEMNNKIKNEGDKI